MPKWFNTAGPCQPEIHYMLPPTARFPGIERIIDQRGYFVVHAPRQTGKTTAMLALAQELTASGNYTAIMVSTEVGQPFSYDPDKAAINILESWRQAARAWLPPKLQPPPWPQVDGNRIGAALAAWCQASPRPLVVFIDEIDALMADALIAILRQLRDGYPRRPENFPHSLALIGLGDVRDYKVASGGSTRLQTASPFNIKVKSLTLRNFNQTEILQLYQQHTEETGQQFTTDAIQTAYELTQGQPWLVNALAKEIVEELVPNSEQTIGVDYIYAAKEILIQRQDTHLDSLAERLREDRVKAIIEPILAGQSLPVVPNEDLQYVLDLGLCSLANGGGIVIANPIYQEVLPRVLAKVPQASLPMIAPSWLNDQGELVPEALLKAFLAFWQQHGEPLLKSAPYHEKDYNRISRNCQQTSGNCNSRIKMSPNMNHPDAIKRIHGKGFVDYTITRRLPKILANIEEQLEGQLETAQAMLQAVITGSAIDTTIFTRPTAYWNNYLDQLAGSTWDDLPFFDLEFLFYHGLNSIAGYFDTGVDVFRQARQKVLVEAIPDLGTGLTTISDLSGIDLLRSTIRGALFANEADYSQLITSRSDSSLWHERVLLDDSEQWISHLQQDNQKGDIHIIVDNAGHELCWDLVMIDALLRLFNTIRVVIHVKPWPMFVSDALSIDVEETINHFLSSNLSDDMRLLGQRLQTAMDCDRIRIQAEADWGEPRHFNALDSNLRFPLGNAVGVISKGDLNYRRLVQDLQWPMDTPSTLATDGVPFHAFALRVLKSDALVGIEPSTTAHAATQFNDWRTRGYFAVMQLL